MPTSPKKPESPHKEYIRYAGLGFEILACILYLWALDMALIAGYQPRSLGFYCFLTDGLRCHIPHDPNHRQRIDPKPP